MLPKNYLQQLKQISLSEQEQLEAARFKAKPSKLELIQPIHQPNERKLRYAKTIRT